MGSADTTSYDTKGQVGFTGNWVRPESSSSSKENPKKRPSNYSDHTPKNRRYGILINGN